MRCVAAALMMLSVACRHEPPTLAPENPVTVEEVRLEGFDVLPVRVFEEFRDAFPIGVGTSLTSKLEQDAGDKAVEVLQNHGYPYAQVRSIREPIDPTRARLVIRAEPGTRGIFGRIDIAGHRHVDEAIIRRRVLYVPGDLFRRSAIEQSQQRIGAMGLFKSVEIRAQNVDARPAQVPTLITVEERSPWRWNLGLGYAAGEQLGVDARISHLNFFGAARRADVEGRVSRIERSAGVAFTQTDAWHPAMSLALEARHREIDERSFFVVSRGGQAGVSWQWTRDLSATFSYAAALERSEVDSELDILAGLQDGMLSAWAIDLEQRRTALLVEGGATAFAPVRRVMQLHIEQAGGWMPGTFNYFNVVGDARVYRPLFGDRVLLAGRARYGAIRPMTTEADIPLLKRSFLGGSNEMRGWGIYEVSPLSASGEPVGGKSVFSLTVEGRFPIAPRVTAAFFVEAGQVWQNAWSLDFKRLLYDAGPGVRIATPFGLVRVDFGVQLKTLDGLRIDGKPQKHRWRINFGFGEAF